MGVFRNSALFSVALLTLAWLFFGTAGLFTASILAILEVSLSFDNAVVNAKVLTKMSVIWRKRFLIWGMLIAVGGMRLYFPVLIVSIISGLGQWDVATLAVNNPEKYAHYLHECHTAVNAFGGMFLGMVFLKWVCNSAKDVHWLGPIEVYLAKAGKVENFAAIAALAILYGTYRLVSPEHAVQTLVAGLFGIMLHLAVDGLVGLFEADEEPGYGDVAKGGFMSFMYLEILDASFSFDGVIGAFALTNVVALITIGLAIGALWVRSLTIWMVEKGILDEFRYLDHGAHWAIGALWAIMLIGIEVPVSEWLTGCLGAGLIFLAVGSSVLYNRKQVVQPA